MSKTNCQNCMIYLISSVVAYCWSINSSFVVSKSIYNLISNWNWAMFKDSNEQFIFITLSDIYWSTWNTNWVSGWFYSTVVCDSEIRVALFLCESTSWENILKCMWWKSTTATMVIKITSTINQLLFTQVSVLPIFNQIMSFYTTNSRKSPTTATFGLIFDWAYTIIISPVPVGRNIFQFVFPHLYSLVSGRAILWSSHNVEVICKFFISHVTVAVDPFFIFGVSISVVFNNLFNFTDKYLFSVMYRTPN